MKDKFETVSVYIIPKEKLQRCMITMWVLLKYSMFLIYIACIEHLFCFRTTKENKILGYPIQIIDQKYLRNAYYFNLCFVCDYKSHTLHYEPILKKLSKFLVSIMI